MYVRQSITGACIVVMLLLATYPLHAFEKLAADEVRKLFSGNTVEGIYREGVRQGVMNFYTEPFTSYFSNDGKVYSAKGGHRKSGRWHVTETGYLCFVWQTKKQEKCAPVYREGDHFKQDMMGRSGNIKWTKTYTGFTPGDTTALQER